MTAVAAILNDVESLPALPTAYTKLCALMGDETSGVRDFELALKHDACLSANILRVANSPYFGQGRQVQSVRHAVGLMGTQRVLEIATSVVLTGQLLEILPGFEIPARRFWVHSVAVAILAERLAKELGLRTPELTFTAGLLHDIGKLVIGTFLAGRSDEVVAPFLGGERALPAAARVVIGADHAEVGAALAEHWRLPEGICHAIRWHHEPERIPENRLQVDLVHVADGLAHTFGHGGDVGGVARGIASGVNKRLGLTTAQLELVGAETLEEIQTLAVSFGETDGGNP